MKSKIKTMSVAALCILMGFAGIHSFAQNSASVADIVSQMPAESNAAAHSLVEKLLESAPESVETVCDMLRPTGKGNTDARYAVNALAAYCSAKGRKAERTMLEAVVLDSISKTDDSDVRAFLMEQLSWIVSDQSVPVLSGLLADETMSAPACRALITLNSKRGEKALIEALPKAELPRQVGIVKALGQMHSAKARKSILKLADSDNSELKDAALFALANIADAADRDLFEQALKNGSQYRKNQHAGYYLAFAEGLSAKGDRKTAIEISKDLMRNGGRINNGVPCAALTLAVDIQGEEAFPLLPAAMQSDNEFMQGTAMRLAKRFASDKHIRSWGEILPSVASVAQLKIVGLLAESGNKTALKPLEKAVESADKSVSAAAIAAMLKLDPAAAADFLLQTLPQLDLAADRQLDFYKFIAPRLRNDRQKERLIGNLADLRSLEALKIVDRFIDDPNLSQTASLAAVSMAAPDSSGGKALTAPEVADVLFRAAQNIDDPNTREKAMAIVAKVKDIHGIDDAIPDKLDGSFVQLFNGKNLAGWQGLMQKPYDNPHKRAELSAGERAKLQAEADEVMKKHWSVEDGVLVFDGGGTSLATGKDYADFEMFVDWKIEPRGDSGVYLRGYPQVQIWDPNQHKIGSGGLYNNKKHPSRPLALADNPIGEWNTFYIKMVGDKVTVYLNDVLVVDDVTLENYWDRGKPILPAGQIELQAHGDVVHFKDVYLREIRTDKAELAKEEADEGFELLFNGYNLDGWFGNTKAHVAENGVLKFDPKLGGGHLYTDKEYDDFVFRFEFKLTPGANNGLGIRTPPEGDPAYVGMELQILDNTAEKYANLKPWQYHGSVYGIVPAELGRLRPVGDWNEQEVIVNGRDIKIVLNGETIVDANLDEAAENGTIDGKKHPGLKRDAGHISFCSHGSLVYFRNIRIKELD